MGGAAHHRFCCCRHGLLFQCRTRLCGWCSSEKSRGGRRRRGFQCRTRLCGWCSLSRNYLAYDSEIVSMPHAALWVVQRNYMYIVIRIRTVSMPHAALWVVQQFPDQPRVLDDDVSMPHAALWVVQLIGGFKMLTNNAGFNAARGFVGGAAQAAPRTFALLLGFQCRTRLCGWCSHTADSRTASVLMFQCRTRLCGWCSSSCP